MSEVTEVSSLERAANAIGAAGYAAFSQSLVGNPAPVHRAYYERVTHPLPGDLVVETTTFQWRDLRGVGHVAVGTLVSYGTEHIVRRKGVDGAEEDWEYDERAWYVEPYCGGDAVRWTDAEFVAIPSRASDFSDWSRP